MPSKKPFTPKTQLEKNQFEKLQAFSSNEDSVTPNHVPHWRIPHTDPKSIRNSHLKTHRVPEELMKYHVRSKFIYLTRQIDYDITGDVGRIPIIFSSESKRLEEIEKSLILQKEVFQAKKKFYKKRKILDLLLLGRNDEESHLFKDSFPFDMFKIVSQRLVLEYRNLKKKCNDLGLKEEELYSMKESPNDIEFEKNLSQSENSQMFELLLTRNKEEYQPYYDKEGKIFRWAIDKIPKKYNGDFRKYLNDFFEIYVNDY